MVIRHTPLLLAGVVLVILSPLAGAAPDRGLLLENGPPISIDRLTGPVVIDGVLTDAAWQGATRIENWYETRPADNIPATPRSTALIAYDEASLYIAFNLEDSDPASIRAALWDRDSIPPTMDFVGLMIDPGGDGKLAQDFAASPSGVQYDGLWSESAGADGSPDFFWDCAGRTNGVGWSLEMRIPFSSLRYTDPNPSHWGILFYRNRPRGFRYEYYSSRMPRDRSCLICNARALEGLRDLPSGSHWVAAPYLSATGVQSAVDGGGSPLGDVVGSGEAGLDLKWLPSPGTIIDATVNPDFSQIESDEAQITTNERFALFVPEKRPFFVEGTDLFTTPINAAHTRSITSPRWGARTTGAGDGYSYTVLAGEDRGGGSVIIPGAESSELAAQDFSSFFAIGRFRAGFGRSFASFLVTDREIQGGGFNRVAGPDLEWWPTEQDVILAQWLYSWSQTPERPDLADSWNGSENKGHAGELTWLRRTGTWDAALSYSDISEAFRADNGFLPQVGYRGAYAEIGHTFYPKDSPITRLRLFTFSRYKTGRNGDLLLREVTPGFGFDSILDSFVRIELGFDEVRAGDTTFTRAQIRPTIRFTPGRLVPLVLLEARIGDEVDFDNTRSGRGATVRVTSDLRPSDHLQLSLLLNRRWLDVDGLDGGKDRLFTTDVARLRTTYLFTPRSWLRLVAEWVETTRNPSLYSVAPDDRTADLGGSLTFAYKLNWQTVLYLGYADTRYLDDDVLQPASRQGFLKISYAFQR